MIRRKRQANTGDVVINNRVDITKRRQGKGDKGNKQKEKKKKKLLQFGIVLMR